MRKLLVVGGVVGALAWAAACGSSSSADIPPADDAAGGEGGTSGGPGGGFGEGGSGSGDGAINVYDPGDGAPGTCTPQVNADGTTPQCADCKDNDGDGLVDWLDPECAGPLDNDEATFGTGISGDNVDACKQDCFFDGNSGQGDDGCDWNLKCDPKVTTGDCVYDPNFKNCPVQSQKCIDNCQKLSPNGCDCFGCCDVKLSDGGSASVRLVSTCSMADIGDPAKCPPCTPQPSCMNGCDTCELCVGKTTLPPECSGSGGSGQTCSTGPVCNATTPCPVGSYCVTGCCVENGVH